MRIRRSVLASLGALVMAGGTLVAISVASDPVAAAGDPLQDAITASAAPGHPWAPAPAGYGVVKQTDVPVRMADGTVLRANIASPSDPATGKPAAGPFPVLMTQSPYGKDVGSPTNSSAIDIDTYFVKRGYIDVVVDVRGTGASGGKFDLFDPAQVADGVALVDWAAALPH